jgi:hypothetical protein
MLGNNAIVNSEEFRGVNQSFIHDIKFNCDVSDAKYWGFFSVCGLLMRYRDLYRSEKGLRPWIEIRREDIAEWITNKESQWPELEQKDFRDVAIGGKKYHPFDIPEINHSLRGQGLIYGAGYGMYMKPTFFLAELRSTREISGLAVHTAGREYVRDLFTSSGMLQGKSIFLRIEPLTMLLLYKFSELNARRVSALEDAFSRYGFHHRQIIDDTFTKKLELMAERYSEVLLSHEVAEAMEDIPEWKDILSCLAGDRKAEHYLRALKDLIADTSDHGPYRRIIETRDRGALGLSIALTEGFRRVLYPEMKNAHQEFLGSENWSLIEDARKTGYARFLSQRNAIINLFRTSSGSEDFILKLKDVIEPPA